MSDESLPRFTDIFIRRPVLATVVSLLILLIGARALMGLPVRQYPFVESSQITVTTTYPGASPDLMQGFITQPIEQAVSSTEGIDYITSSSTQNTSTVTVYLKLNYNANTALAEVLSKVNQVKYLIPKEANDPVVVKQTGMNTSTLYIGFSSTTMSPAAVSDYLSRAVQPILATVPGVAAANLRGGQPFGMRIWLDPQRMAAHGVSAADVTTAIQTNNFQSAPGQAEGYYTVYNVTAETGLVSPEEFRQMIVKAKGDQLVRMGDIANVELGAQAYDQFVLRDGERATYITVDTAPDGNPLEVSKGVRALLPDIERNLPPGLTMDLHFDTSIFITESIREVITTLAESILIVIVVIFLFLGNIRSVVIPVVTIPLSLIGAGIIMAALGFSLNLLTMLAMVLAIGLVVDDAIVVVENVHRWIEQGRPPVQAALIGAREIAAPVISMTLTLAAVYAPIGFLTGLTGTLFREFAFTLAGAVIVSGVIALTLSPMMCSMVLRPEIATHGFAGLIERLFARTVALYGRALDATLTARPLVGAVAIAVVVSAVVMFFNVKSELAPQEDPGYFAALARAPTSANIDFLGKVLQRMDHLVRTTVPEDVREFGIGGMPTPNQGFLGMIMKPWNKRHRTTMEIIPGLQRTFSERLPFAQIIVFDVPDLPGTTGGPPLQLVIDTIDDYPALYRVAEQLKAAALKSGMFLMVTSDLDYDAPVIRLKLDRSKANALGLSMQSIGDTLARLVGGNYVNRFNLQGRSYEVIPQVPRADRFGAEQLRQYYVTSRSGLPIPLSTVMTAERATEPDALSRFDQLNAATLSMVPLPTVTMGRAIDFLEQQCAAILPKGFQHDYTSESRQFLHEGNQLTITFVFALIVIFLVLAAQFESVRDPLVVMVSVPMSISGALLPLFFWIITLNIYTQVGLVTLIGLISKHGILMVEYARQLQLHEGLDRTEAIRRAARIRLRPILMTTAAMVVGLFPLLFASGAGAESRFAIGTVIASGMTIGTIFTLFVLPTVYTVLAKDHRADLKTQRRREIAEIA